MRTQVGNLTPIPPRRLTDAALAAVAYTCLTIGMTWPLPVRLHRDVVWDLGDSLLNIWIIGWVDQHIGRLLTGHLDGLSGFWTANIFYPSPLTLAYSEHLTAQALQVFPVYALTRNLILCYNLLFLSTFILSGLGAYLFVRQLTSSRTAAFVAGVLYAFAPYRIGQFTHLQVLSSQWMPFALYGVRRYFDTRQRRALVYAAFATTAQNLSCGYYMLFFAPFLVLYVAFELSRRGLWRSREIWRDLVLSGLMVTLVTLPFVIPYVALRRQGAPARPIGEVVLYAADVGGYLTAHPAQRAYGGWLRTFPKPEGDLFPGFMALILAATGMFAQVAWRLDHVRRGHEPSTAVFFAVCGILTVWLSLGPVPTAMGKPLGGPAPYSFLYNYVPGFDGLRVPARLAMLVVLFLAILGGYGAAALQSRGRKGTLAAFAASALFLCEAAAVPLKLNGLFAFDDFAPPPARVLPSKEAPEVYRFLSTLPPNSVIAEFPFGDYAYELRYMYYSTVHWKSLVNGYSGGFPDRYVRARSALRFPLQNPDQALAVLRESGATHVVVHEAAFKEGQGAAVSSWLTDRGAVLIATFDTDRVFILPGRGEGARSSIDQRLVHPVARQSVDDVGRAEIIVLHHSNEREVADRIDPEPGACDPVPVIGTVRIRLPGRRRVHDDRQVHAPSRPGTHRLQRIREDVVRSHHLHRPWREQSHVAELPASQQHLAKARVV
jgi:hypothetical protein